MVYNHSFSFCPFFAPFDLSTKQKPARALQPQQV
nr:MAG TPA: hypothetical protein [Caudoviricetes sp.]